MFVVFGLNVRGAENLPEDGPAILVANHNSHIDTMLLMSIFPMRMISKINPVAAADYFFNTKFRKFLFKTLIGAIPLKRSGFVKEDIFADVNEVLKNNHIVIIYPEGTRSMTHEIGDFKNGIYHLVKNNPNVPVIPIYMNGPDRIMPKYDSLIVPHICDSYIGKPLYYKDYNSREFTQAAHDSVVELKKIHTEKQKG